MEQQLGFYLFLLYQIFSGGVGLALLFNCNCVSKIRRGFRISLGCLLIAMVVFFGYGFWKSEMIDWLDVIFLAIAIFYVARCMLAKSWLDKFRYFLTSFFAFIFVIVGSYAIFASLILLVFTDFCVELLMRNNQKKKGNSIFAIGAIFLYLFYSEYLPQKMRLWNGVMQGL